MQGIAIKLSWHWRRGREGLVCSTARLLNGAYESDPDCQGTRTRERRRARRQRGERGIHCFAGSFESSA
jgi:hypothetical protein